MKIAWVTQGSAGWLTPVVDEIRKMGHEIIFNTLDPSFDILFGVSISVQEATFRLHNRFPDIPMVNYNWDVYEWAFKGHPRNYYNLNMYDKLLNASKIVLCPSMSVVYRNEEFFNIPPEKSVIVKTCARDLEIPQESIRDDRFVYMPLRQIPDRNAGWFERAMTELQLSSITSDKKLSEVDYADKVASCSFIVCPWYEASTGGLTLLEGYFIGKPVLVSNSKYMGAKDYLGSRTTYFQYDSYEDFRDKIYYLWSNPKVETCPKEFREQYSYYTMAKNLIMSFEKVL